MRVVHSAAHLLHDPDTELSFGHPVGMYEVTARAEIIRRALEADGSFAFEAPREYGTEPITAVHDPAMLRFLERAWGAWRREGGRGAYLMPDTLHHARLREGMGDAPEPVSIAGGIGYWCFDTATPIVQGTYRAARAAVDVALTTAGLVVGGEHAAYGLCRPPGHHAARRMFGGYCFLNNAAIVAEWLVRETGEPVAVLDVDFHHGNGTQQIFYDRPDVLYTSIHGDPSIAYPYFAGYADETGAVAGAGANLNLPLPPGTDDATYLAALDRALDRISSHGGSIVVVSLGIDTYGQDPISFFALTTAAYHEMGRRTARLGRRLVILQEGGYYVPQLGENVRQWLRGANGDPLVLLANDVGGPTVQQRRSRPG